MTKDQVEQSVENLAEAIEKLMDAKIEILRNDLRSQDPYDDSGCYRTDTKQCDQLRYELERLFKAIG